MSTKLNDYQDVKKFIAENTNNLTLMQREVRRVEEELLPINAPQDFIRDFRWYERNILRVFKELQEIIDETPNAQPPRQKQIVTDPRTVELIDEVSEYITSIGARRNKISEIYLNNRKGNEKYIAEEKAGFEEYNKNYIKNKSAIEHALSSGAYETAAQLFYSLPIYHWNHYIVPLGKNGYEAACAGVREMAAQAQEINAWYEDVANNKIPQKHLHAARMKLADKNLNEIRGRLREQIDQLRSELENSNPKEYDSKWYMEFIKRAERLHGPAAQIARESEVHRKAKKELKELGKNGEMKAHA